MWSVALYGCETWALREGVRIRRLNALEMWKCELEEPEDKHEEVMDIVGEKKARFVETIVGEGKIIR